jgi:hypothetical protein
MKKIKLWKWQEGRQSHCKYLKFPLWYFKIWKFGFDAYILKYPKNGILPYHFDKIDNAKHYRLNIKLKGNSEFRIDGGPYKYQKFVFFRPDLQNHCLYIENKTIKLSFGFVKFN